MDVEISGILNMLRDEKLHRFKQDKAYVQRSLENGEID
jgi:hypothetical protein